MGTGEQQQQEGAGPARGRAEAAAVGKDSSAGTVPSGWGFCVTPTSRSGGDTGREISVSDSEIIQMRIEGTGGLYAPDLYIKSVLLLLWAKSERCQKEFSFVEDK